ncbi:hypothetical protein B9Z19DRAFT_1125374 [Tuber borchii]|uniref:Uncharacterized protein n=1 Tax=Tuber borchii TaxID=42251 RepID=A0A2T6ZVC5_TUBBO|nr:hypothetical protein B9Z19DRAFT_1125374 [Tuber borchii]
MELPCTHDWHPECAVPDISFGHGPASCCQKLAALPAPIPPSPRGTSAPAAALKDSAPKPSLVHEALQKFHEFHFRRRAFDYEQALSIKMPLEDYIEFKKHLHGGGEESDKFPNYSYDTSRSLLFTEHMAGPLHEKLVSMIVKGLNITKSRLPSDIRTRIEVVRNQKFNGFKGLYEGSRKIPDLALQVANEEGDMEVKFVVEVGLTETYTKLVDDARLWLEGIETVSLVMLVKLEEAPIYQCPIRNLSQQRLAKINFPPSNQIAGHHFLLESRYGPAIFNGFTWVGKVSGFFEFWALDQSTKLATCMSSRNDISMMPNNLESGLSLSRLMDVDEKYDEEIFFNWEEYIHTIDRCIKETAAYRCREGLNDAKKRAGGLDTDYQPLSQASSA